MANTTLNLKKNGIPLTDYDGTPWAYDVKLTMFEFDLSVQNKPASFWLTQPTIAVGSGLYSVKGKSWNVSISTPQTQGFYALRAVSLDFTRTAFWFDPVDWKNITNDGQLHDLVFNPANMRDAYNLTIEPGLSFDAPPALPEADSWTIALISLLGVVLALRAKQPHKTR